MQKVPDTCYEFILGHKRHASLQCKSICLTLCVNKDRGHVCSCGYVLWLSICLVVGTNVSHYLCCSSWQVSRFTYCTFCSSGGFLCTNTIWPSLLIMVVKLLISAVLVFNRFSPHGPIPFNLSKFRINTQ